MDSIGLKTKIFTFRQVKNKILATHPHPPNHLIWPTLEQNFLQRPPAALKVSCIVTSGLLLCEDKDAKHTSEIPPNHGFTKYKYSELEDAAC